MTSKQQKKQITKNLLMGNTCRTCFHVWVNLKYCGLKKELTREELTCAKWTNDLDEFAKSFSL